MRKNRITQYLVLMAVGLLLNGVLYLAAHYGHLPVWMDSVGTAFSGVALEPAAGLLVAFATNFYQAAFIYDSSSLIYYAVSATAALAFGIILREKGELRFRKLPLAALVYFVTATLLATLITIWRTSGIPDSGWERRFYETALAWGWPRFVSCLFGTAVLKALDTVIISVLMPVLCKVFKPLIVNKLEKAQ